MNLPLLAVLVQVGASASPALTPDTVFSAPGGPSFALVRTPGEAVVAVRASVALEEDPREAGFGNVLLWLGTARARGAVDQVGGTIEGSRSPWGLVYTVSGAVKDFEYLAWGVRTALARPDPDRVRLGDAVEAALTRLDRQQESTSDLLSARLRRELFPGIPPPLGTDATLAGAAPGSLQHLWDRSHLPARIDFVVVGDVSPELLLAAFGRVGATGPATDGANGGGPPQATADRPGILRRWYGQAHLIPDRFDPRAEVLARLLAQVLEATRGPYETAVELWNSPQGRVLVVKGVAYPEPDYREMRARVRGALQEAARAATEMEVTRLAGQAGLDLLLTARTPAGTVELIGTFMDAGGDPGAVISYLEGLDRVSPASIRELVAALEAGRTVEAEIR